MSQLTPCPECQRHVRKTEARCPFCEVALSLAHLPAPVVPRKRLSRAATFAFGASVVGATALVACGEKQADGRPGYRAPPSAGAGTGTGGIGGGVLYGSPPSGGTNDGEFAGNAAVYGAPFGGAGGDEAGGAPGAGGTNDGEGGSAGPVYGAPAAGAGGV